MLTKLFIVIIVTMGVSGQEDIAIQRYPWYQQSLFRALKLDQHAQYLQLHVIPMSVDFDRADIELTVDMEGMHGLHDHEGRLETSHTFEVMINASGRFGWSPVEFGNVRSVFVVRCSDHIRYPRIRLINAIDVYDGIQNESDDDICQISSTGIVRLFRERRLVTSCLVDATLFPFDYQICDVEVGIYEPRNVWPIGDESSLRLPCFQHFRLSSDDWEVVGMNTSWRPTTRWSDEQILRYRYLLARRGGLPASALLAPAILLQILATAVFLMPLDSGETIILSIGVMIGHLLSLCYVVDAIPHATDQRGTTPVLLAYVFLAFTLSVIAAMYTALMTRLTIVPKRPFSSMSRQRRSLCSVHACNAKQLSSYATRKNSEAQVQGYSRKNSSLVQRYDSIPGMQANEQQEALLQNAAHLSDHDNGKKSSKVQLNCKGVPTTTAAATRPSRRRHSRNSSVNTCFGSCCGCGCCKTYRFANTTGEESSIDSDNSDAILAYPPLNGRLRCEDHLTSITRRNYKLINAVAFMLFLVLQIAALSSLIVSYLTSYSNPTSQKFTVNDITFTNLYLERQRQWSKHNGYGGALPPCRQSNTPTINLMQNSFNPSINTSGIIDFY